MSKYGRPSVPTYYELQYRVDLPDVSYWAIHIAKDGLADIERVRRGAAETAPHRVWRIVECRVMP